MGQRMFFNLSGVDASCTSPTAAANSCGVHVHAGMTCEDAGNISGHYWNASRVAEDPWANVVYATPDNETAVAMAGGVHVATGASNADILGRAFVVHDATGARIACAQLAQPTAAPLITLPFVPYAGYAGEFDSVMGQFLFLSTNGTQSMYYHLQNVDTACSTPAPDVANACGIHIHVGTDCSVVAQGHYWNDSVVTPDPWLTVTYDASSGEAMGAGVEVLTGLTHMQVDNAVFVVHDSAGARIGCAEIEPVAMPPPPMTSATTTMMPPPMLTIGDSMLEAANFVPYPGYTGSLAVAGQVYLLETSVGQMMFFHLTGVDSTCTSPTSAANSCGVHVHSGMTCEDASAIGGHYWNASYASDDPWADVVYSTAGESISTTMAAGVHVATGASNADILGRAFVVHDATGARIACAQLTEPTADALITHPLVPYSGYAGEFDSVMGQFLFLSTNGTQSMYYHLKNVDTACSTPAPDVANACGIHIHVGTDCSVVAQGHYWDDSVVTPDPWLTVTYDASSGEAMGAGVEVFTGLTSEQVDNAVFVVHDSAGTRIGCAEIAPIQALPSTTASTTGEDDDVPSAAVALAHRPVSVVIAVIAAFLVGLRR
eukprot:CAMPEP_0178402328 /NCGR_PEP_ID=MMETSP0689_2-20121128/16781_1 /TAXON_ID=160604 /ORGANISM="Amphidinium massartii, Strain CS-259" /LENGTH=601 /DNA_ID=CAMNT_0020023217 /DNA_START=223 /DNA_END=2028 /DNA_ORIENTATION=+